ncbi:MAG: FG-GAP-like repeat-containing protein [Terriglobales bacterium]
MRKARLSRTLFPIVLIAFAVSGLAQTKGTFQAAIDYSAGPPTIPTNTGFLVGGIEPFDAHVADVNGDGKPDVVIAASCEGPNVPGNDYGISNCPVSGSALVVYLSNGDGTFQAPILTGVPAPLLRSIAVGDFNGDGKPDVFAAMDCLSTQDCSSGSWAVLLGNGDGTFSDEQNGLLTGVVGQAGTVAVGDFNHDGKLDVAVGVECYNLPVNGCGVGAVEVFSGNGDGTLSGPNVYQTVGNSALLPVVGDFNGDGKLDIIAANGYYSLTILLGNGDGTFAETNTSLPFSVTGIVAADFNGDGKLDLAAGAGAATLEVLFGNGDGTFQSPVGYGTGLGSAVTDDAEVVATDLNGDGKPDLIVGGTLGGYGFDGAAVLLNDGHGNFTLSNTYGAGGWEYLFLVPGDFNGDGKSDIVLLSQCPQAPLIANNCPDGTLTVLLGNGNGTLRSARYLDVTSSMPTDGLSVAAADFNGDGLQDLVFPSGCGPGVSCTPSGFTLLLSNGTGGYQTPVSSTAPVEGSRFLIVGDFNGDGKPDVATFNDSDPSATADSVSIFMNTSNGTFAAPNVFEAGGETPTSIVTGDFNGDGKLDIAVLEYDSSSQPLLGILLGNGDGTFQPVITSSTNNFGMWMAAADFNGDGKTDLIMLANATEGSAEVFLSNGDGTFTAGQVYDSGGRGSAVVAAGDVNGDGKPDVVIANQCEPINGDVNCANGSISVLLGNGDGTFNPAPSQVVTDGNLQSMSLADLNADGKLDAVATTETGVAVFLGNGDGTFQAPTIYAALEVAQNVQMAIADLNGDGGLDIVQPSGSQLAILYSQGFQYPIAVPTPASVKFANEVIGTTSATKTVTLSNAGTATLNIAGFTASGDFAVASSTCGATLAVGKKCNVKVTFTPSSLGTRTGGLVFSDNGVPQTQTVALSGAGVEPATLTPAFATYAVRKVGTTSAAKTLTLVNSQSAELDGIAISTSGDFAVSSTTCGTSLAAKGKCTIGVTFMPTATGTRTGQLSVSDSASNSPQVSNLTGTGK